MGTISKCLSKKYCKYFSLKISVWLPSSFPSQWKETETNDQRQDQSIVLQNALYELSKKKNLCELSCRRIRDLERSTAIAVDQHDGWIHRVCSGLQQRRTKAEDLRGVEDEHLFILIVKFYRRVFYNVSGIIKDKTQALFRS